MVPYRGRFALRIARMVLATACLISYVRSTGWHFTWIVALLAAYLVYAVGSMFEIRFDSTVRTNVGLVVDTAYFGFWTYLAPRLDRQHARRLDVRARRFVSIRIGGHVAGSVARHYGRDYCPARFTTLHTTRGNVSGLDGPGPGLRFDRAISL